ncbi:DUF5664 domain-containing protein [Intestinibacillus massiliensis]|nr:DUF5664 domain-containing protein [Intestinibacillus massiliensis]
MTTYGTGARRDDKAGKGRFDLMPMDVASSFAIDDFFRCINNFSETGDTDHLLDAMRSFCHRREWNTYEALLEVAKLFESGAEHYGEDNWKKGIPTYSYLDSACRHYCKYCAGYADEAHDRAVIWNLMCCVWTKWRQKTGMEGAKA